MMNLKEERGSAGSISNVPFLVYIFLGIIIMFLFYEAVFLGYRYYFITDYMDELSEIYTVSNYKGTNLRELDSILETNSGGDDFFGKIDRSEYIADRFEILMEQLMIPPTAWDFDVQEVSDRYNYQGEGIKFLVLEVRVGSFFMPKMFVSNPSAYNSEFVSDYYSEEIDGKATIKFVRAFSHKKEFND